MRSVCVRGWGLLALVLIGWSAGAQTGTQANGGFGAVAQAANAARDQGNTAEAVRDYRQAVALNPAYAEGWWNLGVIAYESNHYADAVSALEQLVKLAPGSAAGWSILGLSQFETKDYDAALASLKKARSLGGIKDAEIEQVSAYHLGMLLVRSGDFTEARRMLGSEFGASPPAQVKTLLGLALLRVPLLPEEVDPSQDALVQAAADAAVSADEVAALGEMVRAHGETPWLHYAYGRALRKAGRLQAALDAEKAETRISVKSGLPWMEIGGLEQALGHRREAAAAAERAEALGPSAGRSQRMIALYGVRAATAGAAMSMAQWQGAMQDYATGRYAEAVAALKVWLEENPADGTSWAVLGLAEYAEKDYDNARIHLQRGINLGVKGSAESVATARERLGVLLVLNGQFDEATSLLKPMASDATNETVQLTLGMALLRLAKLPDALTAAQRELAMRAGAVVELLFGSRYEQAFAGLKAMIAEHPTTPWLHYAYGDALDSLSQYGEAVAEMRAEMKVSPRSALPWIRVAAIEIREHKAADALAAAETAVRMEPESAEAHYQLGRAWLESNDARKAIAELQKANALRANNVEIHFALARAYAKAGEPEMAAKERATFMQLKGAAKSQ